MVIEQLEKDFLAAPNAAGLVTFYDALKDDLQDHLLAGVLEKIRPIQHRITWVQADATPDSTHTQGGNSEQADT